MAQTNNQLPIPWSLSMILPATSHSLYREENRRNLVSGDVTGR